MSGIFAGGLAIPAGAEWIEPWYEELLGGVAAGQSPYLMIKHTVYLLYHPTTPAHFDKQLWALVGVFILAFLLVFAGLVLRFAQARLWFFTRIDSTVVLPNSATLYGLCSLVYSGLGILLIVVTIDIAKGAPVPPYFHGLRRAWFGALWMGAYFEAWSTVCAWHVRSKGAFYRQSRAKSAVAVIRPILLPLAAWVPPSVFFVRASSDYNASARIGDDISTDMDNWQKDFVPGQGFDIARLALLFGPGAELGSRLIASSKNAKIGYAYCRAMLLVLFAIYLVGTALEAAHLTRTVSQLREQARRAARHRLRKDSAAGTAPAAPLPGHAVAQTEDKDVGIDANATDIQDPWMLLAWVRRNRLYTAAAIATMLLVNAGLNLWQAATPLDLRYPSGQFQVEILISCWLNGILATLVSLLLLFRSLDASTSWLVSQLRRRLPFLPFAPSLHLTPATRSLITTEPPRFAAYGAGDIPLVERAATRTLQNDSPPTLDAMGSGTASEFGGSAGDKGDGSWRSRLSASSAVSR
ncbi:uncharacterized protein JCM10292_001894 [Rhodotorula paludigena]|uniref:uncharacterized protein n=1 Tax=Rhodotorula paludigena TaxID=86838 RepID=UPI00317109ED